MLVCPQCQFQNPDTNKFCQQCGFSLTQKTCQECGQLVAFGRLTCPKCEHPTATLWQAIVTPLPEVTSKATAETPVAPMQPPFSVPSASTLPLPSASITSPTPPQPPAATATDSPQYLDLQHRYQVLTPLTSDRTLEQLESELEFQVLDAQPFQVSLIHAISKQIQSLSSADLTQPAIVSHFLDQHNIYLPDSARAYLALKLLFPGTLPALHDTWQAGQQVVVLLEDRSFLPQFTPAWANASVAAPQLLGWLQQMLDLWPAFIAWGCELSLLQAENWRVSDQQLELRRLYFSDQIAASDATILSPLAEFWQQLLRYSPDTQQEFSPLLVGLQEGAGTTLEDLQALLTETARSLTPESLDIEESAAPTLLLPSGDEAGDDAATAILPNQLVKLEAVGQTDTGRDRYQNEDYFVIHNRLQHLITPVGQEVQAQGIYILCDGMGGHAQGEVASSLTAKSLLHYFQTHWEEELPSEATMEAAIYAANQNIFDANEAKGRSGSDRMGTTLVAVLLQDTQARVAHVGDSRLYRLTRRKGLEQVTTDHEVGQREIQRGVEPEIAYARPDAYQLTQAIGPRGDRALKPDIQSLNIYEDTLLLLCSDGFTDNQFLETHWAEHLQPLLHSQSNLEQGIKQLVELADDCNGHDNITLVAVRLKVRPQMPLEF